MEAFLQQHIIATIAVTALVTITVTIVVTKMFDDLMPKGRWFTPRRMICIAAAVCLGIVVYQLVLIATQEVPIASQVASIILALLFGIVMAGAIPTFLIYRMDSRVTIIEKHVGLSGKR